MSYNHQSLRIEDTDILCTNCGGISPVKIQKLLLKRKSKPLKTSARNNNRRKKNSKKIRQRKKKQQAARNKM
jgi:hypothetical protein